MAQDINMNDQSMLWANSLLRQEDGSLVFVCGHEGHYQFTAITEDAEGAMLPFAVPHDDYLQPIQERLGYVNVAENAVYWTRNPIRQYSMGLTRNNTSMTSDGVPLSRDKVSMVLRRLRDVKNTLNGIYPSFEESMQKVTNAGHRSIAFDRQFAVDRAGRIYYKGERVGTVALEATQIEQIMWGAGKEYLYSMLCHEYLLRREHAPQ